LQALRRGAAGSHTRLGKKLWTHSKSCKEVVDAVRKAGIEFVAILLNENVGEIRLHIQPADI